MTLRKRKFLFFVTKQYSFAILEPIQKYILDNKIGEVVWFTASTASTTAPNGIQLKTEEEVIAYQPDAVIVPGKIVPTNWPGIKVQIFHGIDDEVQDFYDVNGQFDLYCTSGPEITEKYNILSKKYRYFSIMETGWPKLDPLYNKLSDSNYEEDIITKLGFNKSKPIILYAPTFPPKYTSANELYSEIVKLADEYQILIKFHTLMDRKIVIKYKNIKNVNINIVEENDIIPLLLISDILVTDTSSVAYEYLPLDRPIITYKTIARFDKGINIIDSKDLHGAIIRSLDNPKEYSENRQFYLNELHPYDDGESSGRVVEAIERFIDNDMSKQLSSKPMNIIRNRKIRKIMSKNVV